jgi:hypothetical protein
LCGVRSPAHNLGLSHANSLSRKHHPMNDEQKAKHDYALQQDSLLWSRVQMLIAGQAGILAGAYVVREHRAVAIPLVAIGIVFTLLLFNLIQHCRFRRDRAFEESGVSRAEPPRTCCAPLRGREIIWLVFVILLVVDIGALVWISIGMP